MIYIINETQFKLIKEQKINIVQFFSNLKYPDMGKLRKRKTHNRMFGEGYKFFNTKNGEVLFHVVWGGPVYLKQDGKGVEQRFPGIRLYVDSELYNQFVNYFADENTLLKWFNETYSQSADRIISGIR